MKCFFLLQSLLITYSIFPQTHKIAKDASILQNGVYKYARFEFDNHNTHMKFSDMEGFKLYTPKYFLYIIYSKTYPVSFGLSNYTLSGNEMMQRFIYSNGSLDTPVSYHVNITLTDTGYIQHMQDFTLMGQKGQFTEVFAAVPAKGTSDLDGLWKTTKSIRVNAGDTTEIKVVQYKMFIKDHYVMFTHYVSDSSAASWKQDIAYGSFSLSGHDLCQDVIISNRYERGRQLKPVVQFRGKDTHTEVFTDSATNTTQIEIYERLK